jgi:lysophospholipase L1-like esterase
MVIALAGFVTAGALPAAANSGTVQYVALGDSYAAGQGAGSYLNGCKQTAKGYPELLDSEKRIHLQANATCSGAKTSEVANTQLSALNPGTRLVTLTVGANDLNVSGVATTCITETLAKCLVAIQEAGNRLPMLGSDLIGLYAKVADAAPRARIVVTGYPYLLQPPAASDRIITETNAATAALNDTIKQAVAATRDAGVKIVYVDVTEKFRGHGIGSTVPFINPAGPDVFHPNAAGYRAYADAISTKLPGGWLDKQKQLV